MQEREYRTNVRNEVRTELWKSRHHAGDGVWARAEKRRTRVYRAICSCGWDVSCVGGNRLGHGHYAHRRSNELRAAAIAAGRTYDECNGTPLWELGSKVTTHGGHCGEMIWRMTTVPQGASRGVLSSLGREASGRHRRKSPGEADDAVAGTP